MLSVLRAGGVPAMTPQEFQCPDDLRERDQWVCWRFVVRNERPTKVPFQTNGQPASSTNPRTWFPFDEAFESWQVKPRRFDGIGYVFSADDPFTGIDLDNCLDGESVKPWARGVIERFGDTYMEVSPSGHGIKIWARGAIPANLPGVAVGDEDGSIEMYARARYFCVTGNSYRGAPLQIEDHAEDLQTLYDRLTPAKRAWALQPMPGGRIPYGQQHSTLVSIAGTLRARLVCEEAILECLQTINRLQCERPGPAANIERIVRSSRKWQATG